MLACGAEPPAAANFVPSAEVATEPNSQSDSGMAFEVQLVPELVEVYIVTEKDPRANAANLVPSAEEATESQLASGPEFVQVAPELAEAKIRPPRNPLGTATSLVPSAEEVTADQFVSGAPVFVQVTPESGEV